MVAIFTDDISKGIFLTDNLYISIKIRWSLFPTIQLTIFQYWFR